MKKLIYTFAIVALLSACTADLEDKQVVIADSTPVSAKILNGSRGCVKGSIIVRFNPSAESRLGECATRSGATRTGVRGVDALLDEVGGYSVEPIFIVTKKNREKVYAGGYHLWYELSFDESSDMEEVASRLAEVGEIERVQYVHLVKRVGAPKVASANHMTAVPLIRASYNNPFNDTYAKYQWGIENIGSAGLVSPALSEIPNAVAIESTPKPTCESPSPIMLYLFKTRLTPKSAAHKLINVPTKIALCINACESISTTVCTTILHLLA